MTEQIIKQWFFSPKQTTALETLNDSKIKEVMYGGAKGGGKSYFGCRWCFGQAIALADFFGFTTSQENPTPVGFMGRQRGADFTKTTLETWKKCIPSDMYVIREHNKEIIIDGRIKLFYGGMDDQKTINKFNSAEFAFIFIDQAEEISRSALGLLKGTLRLSFPGKVPKYKVLLTANPAPCFLRQDYIDDPPKDGSTSFVQALPSDNPYLPSGYVATLTSAFKHRPELVEAYVNGNWDQLDGADILIKHSWVINCVEKKIHTAHNRKVTVADVARFGNDETVIYNMIDNKIVGEKIYGNKDSTITAGNIVVMAGEFGADAIAIDGDGMGGPVVDMVHKILRESNNKTIVIEIRSGKKAEKEDKFVNSRSEMWFHAADMMAKGECSIPNDQVLIGQLSSIKYSPNGPGGRFAVEKKAEIKKRVDGSPDRADAFVYGLWAMTKVAKSKYDFARVDDANALEDNGYGWQMDALANNVGWNY